MFREGCFGLSDPPCAHSIRPSQRLKTQTNGHAFHKNVRRDDAFRVPHYPVTLRANLRNSICPLVYPAAGVEVVQISQRRLEKVPRPRCPAFVFRTALERMYFHVQLVTKPYFLLAASVLSEKLLTPGIAPSALRLKATFCQQRGSAIMSKKMTVAAVPT